MDRFKSWQMTYQHTPSESNYSRDSPSPYLIEHVQERKLRFLSDLEMDWLYGDSDDRGIVLI